MSSPGLRQNLREVGRDSSTHAGLWLDKWLNWAEGGDAEMGETGAVSRLLEAACEIELPDGYKRAFELRKAALADYDGNVVEGVTRFFDASSQGRLVVGLGAQSIRETSIALVHTWGVPYLPGSALKGLAAAAAHASRTPAWSKGSPDSPTPGEDHVLLFGTTESAGFVVFHDAWWIPSLKRGQERLPLDLDVMTVHHMEYYGTGNSPPADWDSPNPVSFLTTRGTFLVALSGPPQWVERAAEWLAIGLRYMGIGAKTAAGYGRMVLDGVSSGLTQSATGGTESSGFAKAEPVDEETLLAQLAAGIQKNNASDAVPKALSQCPESLRPKLAELLIGRLGRKWLKEKAGKKWVGELLAAEGTENRQ